MNDPSEIRYYRSELREVQAVGRPYRYLEGRAVPYNTWQDVGMFHEMHAEGSFSRSTARTPELPLLVGHDHQNLDNLIGKAEKWRHDSTGMYGVWRLNDSPKAQQTARLAESGDLRGLSVGFMPGEFGKDWDYAKPRDDRDLGDWIVRTNSRLLEVSVTPVPAFEGAEVTMVRTLYDPDARERTPIATPELDRWREWAATLHSG
jgi:HK97 family phage prohead protease